MTRDGPRADLYSPSWRDVFREWGLRWRLRSWCWLPRLPATTRARHVHPVNKRIAGARAGRRASRAAFRTEHLAGVSVVRAGAARRPRPRRRAVRVVTVLAAWRPARRRRSRIATTGRAAPRTWGRASAVRASAETTACGARA